MTIRPWQFLTTYKQSLLLKSLKRDSSQVKEPSQLSQQELNKKLKKNLLATKPIGL